MLRIEKAVWALLAALPLLFSVENLGDHRLVYPTGLAVDHQGNLYVSDIGTHQVFKWSAQAGLTLVAGVGEGGFAGDDGPAVKAKLFTPHDLAFDRAGNLLIADSYNHRIRRVDAAGVIRTVAGNGKGEYSGDNGPATDAALNNPQSIAIDGEGNLLIADTFNHVVRRVDAKGVITTFAGTEAGLAGDGGPATKAQISLPMAVALDPEGNLYISDGGNSRVRRVARSGEMTTVVGTGGGAGIAGAGFTGDGGPAERARIFAPADLEWDDASTLFISDSGNNRIRMVRYGVISTIAGNGMPGFKGDGDRALSCAFNTPQKIALGKDGTIFVADRVNRRIRKIDRSGLISTLVAGGNPVEILVEPVILKPEPKSDDES